MQITSVRESMEHSMRVFFFKLKKMKAKKKKRKYHRIPKQKRKKNNEMPMICDFEHVEIECTQC